MIGICNLCGQKSELLDSHVLPSFGYKRYVADQQKGGVFGDLSRLKFHGEQYTEPLFCAKCDNERISQCENEAARWLQRFEANPTAPTPYGEFLLKFTASLSLRWALCYLLKNPNANAAAVTPAIRCWKQFLLRNRADVAPYTQHAFLVFDPINGVHNGMGGCCTF
jgi:hypothetical protein